MKTFPVTIFVLFAALLLSACTAEDLAGLTGADNPKTIEPLSGQPGQVGESEVEGQIAPLIGQGGGNVNSPGYPPADNSGNISSGGGEGVVAPGGDQAGMLPSSSGSAELGDSGQTAPVKWLSYVDQAFKFSIQYPDSYVILPDNIEPLSGNISDGLIHQVRFQDRDLAAGDTAALEPPQFTVEVFAFPGQTSLEAFIKSNLPFSNMTIEPYTYGKLTGLRASTNRMLAPNAFYFFAGQGMLYKLTPLGQYSTEMLQSFTILP